VRVLRTLHDAVALGIEHGGAKEAKEEKAGDSLRFERGELRPHFLLQTAGHLPEAPADAGE
jgi:hypothetical protein